MTLLADTCARIVRVDDAMAERTQRRLALKTKPRRSLGRLEDLACRVAAIRGTPEPALPRKAIVVMGADHGVALEGVSAYPQEVTRQMLANFAGGGAAICVLARVAGRSPPAAPARAARPPAAAPPPPRPPGPPPPRRRHRAPARPALAAP